MGKLFGTDGVRGVANTELTPELAFKLGQAGAYVLSKKSSLTPVIMVGKDTRISGDLLEAALCAGICSVGAKAVRLGVIPTPAVAYLTRKYKANAGVVISASHNPYEFNGIKFFGGNGFKLNDEIENEIEDIILNNTEKMPTPRNAEIGRIEFLGDPVAEYVEYAKSTVSTPLSGVKIAIDCANGASFETAPKALSELGAEIVAIHYSPNGVNINANCGSTHMNDLAKTVVDNKCDLGLAFDGDADRLLAVDENGNFVDGDIIMAICALDLKERGKLKNNTLVATVMSNLGLFIMGKEQGIEILQASVGDRYVLEEMVAGGHVIGGEQSGHVIFLDHSTTGDGLVTALQLLDTIKRKETKLSELASVVSIMPQALYNAKVKNKNKYTFMDEPDIAKECKALEDKFAGQGRVLIRPSGTEPLVRVMIEGKNQKEIEEEAKKLAKLIEKKLL